MPEPSLAQFVKVYDGALSPQRCEELIARFEAAPELHEKKSLKDAYSFSQLNVTAHWPDVEAEIHGVFSAGFRQYHKALGIGSAWPTQPVPEAIRLKRYLPGGDDSFPVHVDVMDSAAARRFITVILYLNAPQGGETTFPGLGVVVHPAPGRLSIFPPLWLFPHAGMPPRGSAKYILHGYLWYPDQSERPYPV